jgi:FdrA protein
LEFLAQDPATRVISLVSKPPDPDVAARILAAAQATQKPVVIYLLGFAPPGRRLGRLCFASSLADAASLAMDPLSGSSDVGKASIHSGDIRGLFSGGTLAAEVLQGLQALVHPIFSNAPLRETQRMVDPLHSRGHTLLDLGDDQFTVGRLHPMLDNDLRIRRLRQEAADPATGTLLLDVVLGVGSHPDPTAELAPAIADCLRLRPAIAVGVLLVGTDEDPQGLDRQRDQLTSAGCAVFETASDLVEFAAGRAAPPSLPSGPPVRIVPPLRAINVGLSSFFESLQDQGAAAVHVDWRPPAGGDEALMEILARMGR